MKTALFTLFLGFALLGTALAQDYSVDSDSKTAIGKLEFLAGKWKGSGWMNGRDGQKHEFDQKENIQTKLDGTALLIEGHGTSGDQTVHMALAIIRWDREKGEYDFNSFLPDGRSGSFKAELKEGKLYWYPNDFITYIISINENGQWYETGEMKRGENTIQFFEMTLDRVE